MGARRARARRDGPRRGIRSARRAGARPTCATAAPPRTATCSTSPGSRSPPRSPAARASARTSAPTTRDRSAAEADARPRTPPTPSAPSPTTPMPRGRLMTDRREIDRIVGGRARRGRAVGRPHVRDAHPGGRHGHRRARRPRARRAQRHRRVRGRVPPRRPGDRGRARSPPTATRSPPATCSPACTGRHAASCTAERVALNLVQRMSGIATLTARYVAAVAGTRRPDRRHPQDHAGAAQPRAPGRARRRRPQPPALALRRGDGQGQPPRRAHRGRAVDLATALRAARERMPHTAHLEVEVDRLDQLDAVLAGGVDTIMLDNFTARRPAGGRRAASPGAPWSRHRAGSTLDTVARDRRDRASTSSRSARSRTRCARSTSGSTSTRVGRRSPPVDPGAAVIYLDHAATTPVRREALEAMWPYLTGAFGNPSSRHELGDEAARALAAARAEVAAVVGCRPGRRRLHERRHRGRQPRGQGHRAGEPARPARRGLADRARGGARVGGVPGARARLRRRRGRRRRGRARASRGARRASSGPTPTLVSVQLANNEIGTVQPIAELAAIAHAAGALMHTDAVQAAGWLALSTRRARRRRALARRPQGRRPEGRPARSSCAAGSRSSRCCTAAARSADAGRAPRTWPAPWRSPRRCGSPRPSERMPRRASRALGARARRPRHVGGAAARVLTGDPDATAARHRLVRVPGHERRGRAARARARRRHLLERLGVRRGQRRAVARAHRDRRPAPSSRRPRCASRWAPRPPPTRSRRPRQRSPGRCRRCALS